MHLLPAFRGYLTLENPKRPAAWLRNFLAQAHSLEGATWRDMRVGQVNDNKAHIGQITVYIISRSTVDHLTIYVVISRSTHCRSSHDLEHLIIYRTFHDLDHLTI